MFLKRLETFLFLLGLVFLPSTIYNTATEMNFNVYIIQILINKIKLKLVPYQMIQLNFNLKIGILIVSTQTKVNFIPNSTFIHSNVP